MLRICFHHILFYYLLLSILNKILNYTTVFEINKVFICAPDGCTERKNGAPGQLFMCCLLYEPIYNFRKACTRRVHRCQKLCTLQPKCAHWVQGAQLISNTVLLLFIMLSSRITVTAGCATFVSQIYTNIIFLTLPYQCHGHFYIFMRIKHSY